MQKRETAMRTIGTALQKIEIALFIIDIYIYSCLDVKLSFSIVEFVDTMLTSPSPLSKSHQLRNNPCLSYITSHQTRSS
ncbi:unnamed protein product [Prunus armeniaca]